MSPVCKQTVFIEGNITEGSINCNETYDTTPVKKAKKGKLFFHGISFVISMFVFKKSILSKSNFRKNCLYIY
jgi:hypothetical protein